MCVVLHSITNECSFKCSSRNVQFHELSYSCHQWVFLGMYSMSAKNVFHVIDEYNSCHQWMYSMSLGSYTGWSTCHKLSGLPSRSAILKTCSAVSLNTSPYLKLSGSLTCNKDRLILNIGTYTTYIIHRAVSFNPSPYLKLPGSLIRTD